MDVNIFKYFMYPPLGTKVIDVNQLNSETRNYLRGHLEAAMVSEAVRSNMHMDTRVIEVAGFKSQVELDLQDF